MRLVRVGEAAADLLGRRGCGRVVAVFRRAVYLSLRGGLLVLVEVDAEPGPLHAHVTALPAAAIGDPVQVEGGDLYVAGLRVPGCADVWRPRPLTNPGTVTAVLRGVLDHEPDLDLAGNPGPAGEERLSATLRRQGLVAAVPVLAGRGTGLTPAGDDVLAGLLFVARAAAGTAHEARLVALARQAPTHDISRAFLEWAGRGRSLAALHDLAAACASGDARRAGAARARLASVGRTSGLDLAYGVLVGSANCATAPWPGPGPGARRSDSRQ